MNPLLRLSIPGEPVGKGRPRAAVIAGHARLYTPSNTAAWEGKAATLARNAWGSGPLDEPVAVTVRAVAVRPQRLLRRKDPEGRLWRTSKPDLDNCIKAVLDALVNAGVLRDDVLVVSLVAQSLYTARDEGPCVEVLVHAVQADVVTEPVPVLRPEQGRLFGVGG